MTTERTPGRELSGEDMARTLAEFVNVIGNDKSADFVTHLTEREHRTLQANTFRLFLNLVAAWSQLPDSKIDMRNEDVRSMCREIVETLGGRGPRPI